ncbi:MAG: hypothetical protein IKO11_03715 [Lachnospiraceae bacterium]|nr:hypothetical protein [Lachnospiraceae bacterium]
MGLLDQVFSTVSNTVSQAAGALSSGLNSAWMGEQHMSIGEPAPESIDALRAAVDVRDPRSVAAYWVYSTMLLTADYDIGMSMLKYLFADLEPFGRGFTEGGNTGKAGFDSFFNERLRSDDYRWLPRTYFEGSTAANGFHPSRPFTVHLHYNPTNTDAINQQSLQQLGRLNIVYWVKSGAAGNQVNITLSRFDGSDRWYVTSGASYGGIFYDQRAGLTAEAKAKLYS